MITNNSINANVITYQNLLDPTARVISVNKHYKNSDEILRDFRFDKSKYNLIIAKNSIIQSAKFDLKDGDIVNLSLIPKGGGDDGGKQVLGIVAMIAITVASAGAGAAFGASVGSALFGTSAAATAMGTALVTMGVATAGGLLLKAVMPKPENPLSKQGYTHSRAYGWSKATNQAGQGAVVPKIYGTHKITPPLIASYVESIDDKQYLNALYALNDGVIKSISDIKINGEDIANFTATKHEIRNGEVNQAIVANFNDTIYDKAVSKKITLNGDWLEAQTDGNKVQNFSITLLFPNGIFTTDNKGFYTTTLTISLQWRKANAPNWDESLWQKDDLGHIVYNGIYTKTLQMCEQHTLRKTYTIKNLDPAQYEVRVKVSGENYGDCVFEMLSERIKDDFIYPSTALLAIRALATNQLHGSMPQITAIISANSNNPAEICKSILKDCGVKDSQISSSFDEWAQFCNENNFTCNIVFDSELSVRKALDSVSILGRASVLQAGSKFEAIIDQPNSMPVQNFLFGMGNILSDTFKQSFVPIIDRANSIEVTYYDKNKDYEPSIVSISDKFGNAIDKKSAVNLIGCTDEKQAKAYGQFMLNSNRYLTQMVEFEAFSESLVCRYGDIIKVSHDVPRYAQSGRLLSDPQKEPNSKYSILELDRDLEFEKPRRYAICIKDDENKISEFNVVNFIDKNRILVFLDDKKFKQFDNYSFGEIDKTAKLFRIIKIATGSNFTRQITAIEYNENVYQNSEFIASKDESATTLLNLRVSENLLLNDAKTITPWLFLAWSGDSLFYDVVITELPNEAMQSKRVYENRASFEVKQGITYEICVKDTFSQSIKTTHKVLGKLAPPPKVKNIKAKENRDFYLLNWDYEDKPLDFSHFEIYSNDKFITTCTLNNAQIPKTHLKQTIKILAIDTSAIKSAPTQITLKATPPENVEIFSTFHKDNHLFIYWNDCGENLLYEVRKGTEDWHGAYKIIQTQELTQQIRFNGNYFIKSYYINAYGLKMYCQSAKMLIIDEQSIDGNVVEKITAPIFKGTHQNTKTFLNGLCLSGDYTNLEVKKRLVSHLNGIFEFEKIIVLSGVKMCLLSAYMDVCALDLSVNFDEFINVDEVENIDGFDFAKNSAILQISTSKNAKDYEPFKDFHNGEYIFKAVKFRLLLNTAKRHISPFINAINILVDMPDIIESSSTISNANGAISILYKNIFSITPKVQITIIDAQSGDDAIISNETIKGFEIKILDKDKNCVKRNFNYIAKGY